MTEGTAQHDSNACGRGLRRRGHPLARGIYRYLTQTITVPTVADLRPLQQSKNLTLTTAANHFGVWPGLISSLERGTRHNDQLAQTYREWLQTA